MPTPTENLLAGLDNLSEEQLNAAFDGEISTDTEDVNYLQYLQGLQKQLTDKGAGKTFFQRYGLVFMGIGVFILVLLLFKNFGKK